MTTLNDLQIMTIMEDEGLAPERVFVGRLDSRVVWHTIAEGAMQTVCGKQLNELTDPLQVSRAARNLCPACSA